MTSVSAPITAALGPQEPAPRRVHVGVRCDGASCPNDRAVVGVRFKCGQCADYDLCRACFGVNTADATWGTVHGHERHEWVTTTVPTRAPLAVVCVVVKHPLTVSAPPAAVDAAAGVPKVGLPDVPGGVPYALRLAHSHSRNADATVTVDGRGIGTFRVPPHAVVDVARPAAEDRALLFMAHADAGAAAAGLREQACHGDVTVAWRFAREAPRPPHRQFFSFAGDEGCNADNDMLLGDRGAATGAAGAAGTLMPTERTGGTVLGGSTGSNVHTVSGVVADPALNETVTFRMVIDAALPVPQPKVALSAWTPATAAW
jgi:hypothetical protein